MRRVENRKHVLFFLCLQDLQDLEKQLEVLKNTAPTGTGGDDPSLDDRLGKLQENAGLLANATDSILKSLEGSCTFSRWTHMDVLKSTNSFADHNYS